MAVSLVSEFVLNFHNLLRSFVLGILNFHEAKIPQKIYVTVSSSHYILKYETVRTWATYLPLSQVMFHL